MIKYYKNILLVLFAIYVVYISSSFLIVKGHPFFNKNFIKYPLTQFDYALHFIHAEEVSLFFKAHHRLWGYSPYNCSGYIVGLFDTLSNNWAVLIMCILGKLGKPELIFNLSIFLSCLMLPFLALFAVRNFGFGKINTLCFLILSMFLTLGFRKAAELADFYTYGVYAFPLAVFLSFLTSSLFYKYIRDKKNTVLIGFILSGSLALFVHPLSFFLCLFVCLPLMVGYSSGISLKDAGKLALGIGLIFAVNAIWILPLIKFSYLKGAAAAYFQTDRHSLLRVFHKSPSLVLLILFLFSVYVSLKDKDRRFIWCILGSWLLFFTVSFFGSQIHLSFIQPYRFILPLSLLSLIPVCRICESQFRRKNYIFIFLLILLAGLLFSRAKKYTFGYERFESAGKIIEFIKENTASNSRIHVEDSIYDPYFGSKFIGMISYWTSREVVASPCPLPQDKFIFAQFINGRIFGKELDKISPKERRDYFDLYNIKYFLVFSDAAREFLKVNNEFKQVFNSGEYSIYEYLKPSESYCYDCKATVEAGYDKIEVRNAQSKVTILKYHYIPTFRITPASLKIGPVKLLDDPVPFIRVENGDRTDFTIYNP